MHGLRLTFSFLIISAFIISAFASTPMAASITIGESSFNDQSRNRVITYRLYAPNPVPEHAPVVIFSHSLGDNYEAATYLGEAMAADGYMAFFIQHPGSDMSVWEGLGDPSEIKHALRQSVRNRRNAINRYKDISYFIDQLETLNGIDGPLEDMMDLDKIAIAGHAYGARTALYSIGEKAITGEAKYKDPRIKVAILLSPGLPDGYASRPYEEVAALYEKVNVPILHLTGTKDDDPFRTGFDPFSRTLPYQHIPSSPQYLLIIDGADHETFGAGDFLQGKQTDYPYHKLIKEAVLYFLNIHLRGDEIAKQDFLLEWAKDLSKKHHFEHK